MNTNDLLLLRRKVVIGTIAVAAWMTVLLLSFTPDAFDPLGPLAIICGWILTAGWVFADARFTGRRALRWALFAVVAGPLAILVYVLSFPPTAARCTRCGGTLSSAAQACPLCGERTLTGKAAATADHVYTGLVESLGRRVPERSRQTAKYMAFALAGSAFFGLILLDCTQNSLIAVICVLSIAAYWGIVPWWVYLDATWRKMDGIPWALLTLVTNVFGLVTYLVIRYPDPRTCPHCGEYLTPELKRCPFCGSEPEPACPRCQSPIKPGWLYCPSCATQLPQKGTPLAAKEESPQSSAPPSVSITGTVTDATTQSPISGAEIRLDSKVDARSITTDPLGRYILAELPPRPHVVLASAPGYVQQAKAYSPEAGGNSHLHFSLCPTPGLPSEERPGGNAVGGGSGSIVSMDTHDSGYAGATSAGVAGRGVIRWLTDHFRGYMRLPAWTFCWRITLEGLFVSLVLAALLQPLVGPETRFEGWEPGEFFLLAVVFAPAMETMLLQAVPVFVAQAVGLGFKGQMLSATIPFASLHFVDGIATGISAGLIGGLYFAFTYIHWRRISLQSALWVTTLSHSMRNLICFAAFTLAYGH